jgi:hypothetical protein
MQEKTKPCKGDIFILSRCSIGNCRPYGALVSALSFFYQNFSPTGFLLKEEPVVFLAP